MSQNPNTIAGGGKQARIELQEAWRHFHAEDWRRAAECFSRVLPVQAACASAEPEPVLVAGAKPSPGHPAPGADVTAAREGADTVVVIPTTNRPVMLRTALASVCRQTARHRICKVVVSENTEEAAGTAAVCAEFGDDLAIALVHRNPSLPVLDHMRELSIADHGAPFVAVLHDDDWWSADHLRRSLDAIATHGAVACYSAFFNVTGEVSLLNSDTNVLFWFGSGYRRLDESWVLDGEAIIMSFLAATPGRYSSLVAQARVLRDCADVYALGNPFDYDRMLAVRLVTKGRIAFCPIPTVFIREHRGQDSGRFSMDQIERQMLDTTRWILKQADGLGVNVEAALAARVARCPPANRKAVFDALGTPWLRAAMSNCVSVPEVLRANWRHTESNSSVALSRYVIAWRSKYEAAIALVAIGQGATALRLFLEAVKSVESCDNPAVTLDALLEISAPLARLDQSRGCCLADIAAQLADKMKRPADRERARRILAEIRPGQNRAPHPSRNAAVPLQKSVV